MLCNVQNYKSYISAFVLLKVGISEETPSQKFKIRMDFFLNFVESLRERKSGCVNTEH